MSEPMRQREKGEGDKVRAASHASWPEQGIGVGGEGCVGSAGAGESSHSDSLEGTQVLNLGWFKRRRGDVLYVVGDGRKCTFLVPHLH